MFGAKLPIGICGASSSITGAQVTVWTFLTKKKPPRGWEGFFRITRGWLGDWNQDGKIVDGEVGTTMGEVTVSYW